VIFLKKIQIK